ncbi:MAG: hypothetical protein V3T17_11220 [Pseudomonadales bacterium]
MPNLTNPNSNLAYEHLRESDTGKALIVQSESDAAIFLFDLSSGDLNSEVSKNLTAHDIYMAVTLSSSLKFEVDNETYAVIPYYPFLNDDDALELLADVRSRIEDSLLFAALNSDAIFLP